MSWEVLNDKDGVGRLAEDGLEIVGRLVHRVEKHVLAGQFAKRPGGRSASYEAEALVAVVASLAHCRSGSK